MNLITKLAYNALTKTIQAIAPGGSSRQIPDYEQGSWTPFITAATPATSYAYSNQGGYFIRIGKVVIYQAYVRWTSTTGTPVGEMRIGGLPFTASSASNSYAAVSVYADSITLPASRTQITPFVALGTNHIKIYAAGSGVPEILVDSASNISAGTREFIVSGTYLID